MKNILIEGADDDKISIIMEQVKKYIESKGKTAEIVLFPRCNESGGMLVNNHLNEFPHPVLDCELSIHQVCSNYLYDNANMVFAECIETGKMMLLEIKYVKAFMFLAVDCISKTEYIFRVGSSFAQKFIFYKSRDNNIIKHGVHASHMTKSLLYTEDRNIWFTNNINRLKDVDYTLVNRSWLSNYLYRTVDIHNEEDFLEYIITIFNIEVKSNNFQNIDVSSIFIRFDDVDNELNILENKYLERDVNYLARFKRNSQYIKTIHYNYSHLQQLIQSTQIKYPKIYQKYKKYVEMSSIWYKSIEDCVNIIINTIL